MISFVQVTIDANGLIIKKLLEQKENSSATRKMLGVKLLKRRNLEVGVIDQPDGWTQNVKSSPR